VFFLFVVLKTKKRGGGTATRLVLPLREGPEMPTTNGRTHLMHPSAALRPFIFPTTSGLLSDQIAQFAQ
jgi:hypothetical protein